MSIDQAAPTGPIDVHRDDREAAHAFVAHISRSLDFYRVLGCEVRLVADGWVQLRHDGTVFVLEQAADHIPSASVPLVRLGSADLRALRRRLLARGISTHSGGGPAHEFEVIDPDGHRVIVWESRIRE